jgi:chromosome segregation and condensation protein ScpB
VSRRCGTSVGLDTELEDLLPEMRQRVWRGRVEAVIFASPKPVTREVLAGLVGKRCNLDALIEDIRAELTDRPYELIAVAGGWQHRTRKLHADAVSFATDGDNPPLELTKLEMLVLSAIAYFQPTTRRDRQFAIAG